MFKVQDFETLGFLKQSMLFIAKKTCFIFPCFAQGPRKLKVSRKIFSLIDFVHESA